MLNLHEGRSIEIDIGEVLMLDFGALGLAFVGWVLHVIGRWCAWLFWTIVRSYGCHVLLIVPRYLPYLGRHTWVDLLGLFYGD